MNQIETDEKCADCKHIFEQITLFCADNDFDMHATVAAWVECVTLYLNAFYKHDDEARMQVADKIIQYLRERSNTVKQ